MRPSLSAARKRMQQVVDGATLQDAYSKENFYAPIGDKIREDYQVILDRLKETD